MAALAASPRYHWERVSITDEDRLAAIMAHTPVHALVNFAAESHVDRSIANPGTFVETNVLGTDRLLQLSRRFGVERFVQISTDEVYGSLGPTGAFTEESPLDPSSPYSASKAAADLLVQAAHRTFGQNVGITRCSNNYGPHQFPEKLIPLFITNGLRGEPWPLYGDGENIRDWLYVEDHVEAVWEVLTRGEPGRVYNIGGENEQPNRAVAKTLCQLLGLPASVIVPVRDRPGHDRRYAIDASRIRRELDWRPRHTWTQALAETVQWYRTHPAWWESILDGTYQQPQAG